jgi:hypothetical protein
MPTRISACLSQLTTLTELAGMVFHRRLRLPDPDASEDEHDQFGVWLPAARLVHNLTRLRRLALYTFRDRTPDLGPCVAGALCDLAPCAGTLEELALSVHWDSTAGALQFERVHSLHLSTIFSSINPKSLALAFPNCRTAIFGDTWANTFSALPTLAAITGLGGRLESLALTGPKLQGRISDLAACSGLRSLQLQMTKECWVDDKKLELTRDHVESLVDCLPNLLQLQVHSCWFAWNDGHFTAKLVAAAARNGRTLAAGVSTDFLWPQPCLLPRIGSLACPPR